VGGFEVGERSDEDLDFIEPVSLGGGAAQEISQPAQFLLTS
jgi:hypothetical protein